MRIQHFSFHLSQYLRSVPGLHNALRTVYCMFFPGIRATIEKIFRNQKKMVVLKIGANDGVTNDQLAEFLLKDTRYRGVMVEPIPLYANLLRRNYAHTGRFEVVQAAIVDTDTECQLFYVDENVLSERGESVPTRYRGIASLSPQHVERELPKYLHRAIATQKVQGISVETLLRKSKLNCCNIIHIDTEGADYLILKQLDLDKLRPEIVLYEHKHLSGQDKMSARLMMERVGYRVRELEVDTLCLRIG